MDPVTVDVEHVGGIDHARVEIPPGVTVLAGPNASNKTSFLRALMSVFGSDAASIKGDEETARVELKIDGRTYDRRLERTGTGVTTGGDPFLDDPELADLFAFLLRSNEARRAVAGGADLRELITRPVDTEAIRERIHELRAEKATIDEELEDIEGLKRRLPELERRKTELETEIGETREELEAVESTIADLDASAGDDRRDRGELQERLAELRDVRSELEDVRRDIETKRQRLASVREERRELEARADDVEVPDVDPDVLEERIAALRSRKRELDGEISELQNTIRFNERMLEAARDGSHSAIPATADGGTSGTTSVTDRLLEDGTRTVCWTCGSEVPVDRIAETLDRLDDLREERIGDVEELESELEEHTDRKAAYERARDERERIRREIDRTEREIGSAEDAIDRLIERKTELMGTVERLEDEVEHLESESYEAVLRHHREANDLEHELGTLEAERDDLIEEIGTVEAELETESDLRSRRDGIREELVELRTRIDRIETEAVEAFNEHMAEILRILEYENVDRIWIEPVDGRAGDGRTREGTTREGTTREGTVHDGGVYEERQTAEGDAFELHVVRSSEGGVAYEDTVDHLSESEREVTGLVFALAGYLVHEVHQEVPLMILDALEQIDRNRIARLLEYFEPYADYLVVALLPEDADALGIDHTRVTDIGG